MRVIVLNLILYCDLAVKTTSLCVHLLRSRGDMEIYTVYKPLLFIFFLPTLRWSRLAQFMIQKKMSLELQKTAQFGPPFTASNQVLASGLNRCFVCPSTCLGQKQGSQKVVSEGGTKTWLGLSLTWERDQCHL